MTNKPPTGEARHDELLSHMAERLVAFWGLLEQRVHNVEEGLKLVRESLAIWTMHDLPRTAPSVHQPVAVEQPTESVQSVTPPQGEALGRKIGAMVIDLLQDQFADAREIALTIPVQFDVEGPYVCVTPLPTAEAEAAYRNGMLHAAQICKNEFAQAPDAARGHDSVWMGGYESACDHLSIAIERASVISCTTAATVPTADEIETWFKEGERQGEDDEAKPQTPCPYAEDTLARHWWTRGYAYASRLLRAYKAEGKVAAPTADYEAVAREIAERWIREPFSPTVPHQEDPDEYMENWRQKVIDRIAAELPALSTATREAGDGRDEAEELRRQLDYTRWERGEAYKRIRDLLTAAPPTNWADKAIEVVNKVCAPRIAEGRLTVSIAGITDALTAARDAEKGKNDG